MEALTEEDVLSLMMSRLCDTMRDCQKLCLDLKCPVDMVGRMTLYATMTLALKLLYIVYPKEEERDEALKVFYKSLGEVIKDV